MEFWIDLATRDGITGWAFGKAGLAEIDVSVNGVPLDVTLIRQERTDVGQAFPQYPHSSQSGFTVQLPASRLDARVPRSDVRVRMTSGKDSREESFSLPSATTATTSSLSRWTEKPSPFPPSVMAAIETASDRSWDTVATWTDASIGEAVDVLLFLLKTGSRQGSELFPYLSYLNRITHAFDFTARNFRYTSGSGGKDILSVASKPQEHFVIAHHLYTLKSRGVPGDLLEFGCFKGFSTSCLSFACQLLGMRMQVFDSFEGLPPSDSTYYEAGDFAGSLDEVKRNVGNFGAPEVVTYHKGFFADSLPHVDLGPVACMWMDVDLKVSAHDALQALGALDRRSCLFSHECSPEYFNDDSGIKSGGGDPNYVLTEIREAFIRDNRQPVGRFLAGNTGVVWDSIRSIPAPGPSILKLYDALRAGDSN
jgi:O-methyltransferase